MQKSYGSEVSIGELYLNMQQYQNVWRKGVEKSVLRIRGSLNIPLRLHTISLFSIDFHILSWQFSSHFVLSGLI